jgi:hypothetical protein
MTLWVGEGKSLRGDMRKEARETLDGHEREGTITILTILERFLVFLNRLGFPNHLCSDSLMLAGWRPASDDRTVIE